MYVGSEPSFDVHVYGAVTEKIGADSYDNGVKPHHNWRGWLLNEAGTGFQQLSLVQGVWSTYMVSPLSLVRAGGGNTQWKTSGQCYLLWIARILLTTNSTFPSIQTWAL